MEFRALAAKHFVETMETLIRAEMEESDPMEHAKAWNEALLTPMDAKGAKWVKAVQRIRNGTPPSHYLAVEYRDYACLKALGVVEEFGVEMPGEASKPSEEDHQSDVSRYWTGMRMLCKLSLLACGLEMEPVPTREEIQANIQKHKSIKQARRGGGGGGTAMSMTAAFQSGIASLGDSIGGEEGEGLAKRMRALEGDALKQASEEWSSGLAQGLEERLKKRDMSLVGKGEEGGREEGEEGATPYEWPVLTKEENARLRTVLASSETCEAWTTLEQTVCFSRVQQNIPVGMLSKIEECAQTLAADITSGAASLDTLDLQKLGESVLSQCSEDDMSKMAGNIGNLLPTIGTLQGAMKGGATTKAAAEAMSNGSELADGVSWEVLACVATCVLTSSLSRIGVASDAYRLPYTPSGGAFSIWGLIFPSLVAFGVEQRKDPVPRAANWLLCASLLLSSAWAVLFSRNTKPYVTAASAVLAVSAAASCASTALVGPKGASGGGWSSSVLTIEAPSCLYSGWLLLAATLGAGIVSKAYGEFTQPLSEQILYAPVAIGVLLSVLLKLPFLLAPVLWGLLFIRTGEASSSIVPGYSNTVLTLIGLTCLGLGGSIYRRTAC